MALRSTKPSQPDAVSAGKINWPPRLDVRGVDLRGTSMMPPSEEDEPTRGVLGDTEDGIVTLPPVKT